MKRSLAYILCLALAISLCVPAFAFEEDGDDEKSELLRAVDIPESLVIFISEEVGHMDDAYEYLSGREPDGKGTTWGGGWPIIFIRPDVDLDTMEYKSVMDIGGFTYEHTFKGDTRTHSMWAFYSCTGGKAKTLMLVTKRIDAEDNDGKVVLYGGSYPDFTPVPFAPMTPLYQKTPPGAELLVLAGSLLLLALSALLRRRRS